MEQKPSVGRIVHYHAPANDDHPANILAALITQINPETGKVSLMMFGPMGFGYRLDVEQGDGPSQWDWPKRV